MGAVIRVIVATSIVAAVSLTLAGPAHADGGAYIDLDRTHYLPGRTGVATTYVSVPRDKEHLLQDGPFYAFLKTGDGWPRPGRPLASGLIRMGTFEVHPEGGGTFELVARITIPDVPGDYYSIAFCNDPCTVVGFREQITGYISIVQTLREARLLNEEQRLHGRIGHLRRDLRKQDKKLAALQTEFDARERDRAYLADEVNHLRHALVGARADARRSAAMPLRSWALGGLAVGLVLAGAMLVAGRRRRRSSLVPDTPEALA
jgi:hypothetical protein